MDCFAVSEYATEASVKFYDVYDQREKEVIVTRWDNKKGCTVVLNNGVNQVTYTFTDDELHAINSLHELTKLLYPEKTE